MGIRELGMGNGEWGMGIGNWGLGIGYCIMFCNFGFSIWYSSLLLGKTGLNWLNRFSLLLHHILQFQIFYLVFLTLARENRFKLVGIPHLLLGKLTNTLNTRILETAYRTY